MIFIRRKQIRSSELNDYIKYFVILVKQSQVYDLYFYRIRLANNQKNKFYNFLYNFNFIINILLNKII